MSTQQIDFWKGGFGKEYTDRNIFTTNQLNEMYVKSVGISREEMNMRFLGNLDRNIKILEVGCNVAQQLMLLQKMGFENLYGIELQEYAIEKAKLQTNGINIIRASGLDIPFKDNFFDLVYTSGVLIHIHPDHLPIVMKEMLRSTNKYIWGYEYYSDKINTIKYRGYEGFLWKADYADEFCKREKNLSVKKKELYTRLEKSDPPNVDCMYLLEKI
jgi:pseudaminic acid biosynthesis-associated methylase